MTLCVSRIFLSGSATKSGLNNILSLSISSIKSITSFTISLFLICINERLILIVKPGLIAGSDIVKLVITDGNTSGIKSSALNNL